MTEFRGNLHQKLGNWNEAIADFTAALQKNPNNHQMRQKIQQVQNSKKIAERKDYYKILNVKRDASKREIKVAFRKLALIWHPDKHKGEELEKANAMFQDLNEAYDVLSNPDKKQRYDNGEDVEGPQQAQGRGGFGFNPFGGGGGHQQFHFKFN
jgi:DnaJ family protein C protein 3